MSLRKRKAFRAIGYGLAGLAIVSWITNVARRALTGGWHDSYVSAKLIPWTFGGAFILICAAALVGLLALLLYVQRRWRARKETGSARSIDGTGD